MSDTITILSFKNCNCKTNLELLIKYTLKDYIPSNDYINMSNINSTNETIVNNKINCETMQKSESIS